MAILKKKTDAEKVSKSSKSIVSKKSDALSLGELHAVLVKPLVTEKTASLQSLGKYSFVVAKDANKIQIARAFEKTYGVKPVNVTVAVVRGSNISKRLLSHDGRRSPWKKAIVTLPKGKKIDVFTNA